MWDIKKFLTENRLTLIEQSLNPFELYDDHPKAGAATKSIMAVIKTVAPKVKSGKMSEEAAAKLVAKEARKWYSTGANDTASLEAITDVLGKAIGKGMEWRVDSY